MATPTLLAAFGDLHANGTTAPCAPRVRLHDGGVYEASELQTWLREDAWEAGWRMVKALKKKHAADLWVLSNGDAVDGPNHHGTVQSVAGTLESQNYILEELCKPFLALSPSRIYVTRGTQSHVGDHEERMGRWLQAVKNPQSGNWSSHVWRFECNGHLVDARHHGRIGMRPWTELGGLGNLSAHIGLANLRAGWRVPRLAIRSHRHIYGDTGSHSTPRVIALPPLQAKTDYAEMRAPEDVPTFGLIAVLFRVGQPEEVHPHLLRPSEP